MLRTKHHVLMFLLLGAIFVLSGCGKSYRVTHDFEEYVSLKSGIYVAPIVDALPNDIDIEKRPSADDLEKLRVQITNEISSQLNVIVNQMAGSQTAYTVNGKVLSYKKGSGFLRFMIGFGAGSAKVTVELVLSENATGNTVFAANFKRTVSSWQESGDQMYKRVAKDFAKAMKKRLEALEDMQTPEIN